MVKAAKIINSNSIDRVDLIQLKLTAFKSHLSWSNSLCSGFNLITGNNGLGKTNILDAIHYLLIGKSYFHHSDQYAIKQGEPLFALQGNFSSEQRVNLGQEAGKIKKLFVNGKPIKLGDWVGQHPVVFIAPDDVELIRGGSEARRKFMDYTLSQLDRNYLKALQKHNKLLQQRNALLKWGWETGRNINDELEGIDRYWVPIVLEIKTLRENFVKDFTPMFNDAYTNLSSGNEVVGLQLKSNFKGASELIGGKNSHGGRVIYGIHKDDLNFEINKNPIKHFGSQGQIKSFLIALKLAQFELLKQKLETMPLILLDDILEKIDAVRAQHLVKSLDSDQFGQVFITDTSQERIKKILKNVKKPLHFIEL